MSNADYIEVLLLSQIFSNPKSSIHVGGKEIAVIDEVCVVEIGDKYKNELA